MSDLAKFLTVATLLSGAFAWQHFQSTEGRSPTGEVAAEMQYFSKKPVAGKPLLLEFWGTYCPPCRQSIPHLNELYGKLGKEVQFLAVSGEDAGTVKSFMASTPMNYPVAVDPQGSYMSKWGIQGVPTAIFLNAEGKEKWRGHPMQLTPLMLADLAQRN